MARLQDQHHSGIARWQWGLLIAFGTWFVLFLVQQGEHPVASYLEQLERKSLDMRFQLRQSVAPPVPDDRIVILMVDQGGIDHHENERLLEEMYTGEPAPWIQDMAWPWPRTMYGDVAQYLRAQGARAVFFDFLFTSESVRDGMCPQEYVDPTVEGEPGKFVCYQPDFGDSELFAMACQTAGITYQSLYFDTIAEGDPADVDGERDPLLEERIQILEGRLAKLGEDPLAAAALPVPFGHGLPKDAVQVPLPGLVSAAAGLGAVNATVDPDGIIRSCGMLYDFRGKTYGSMQVALARAALESTDVELDPGAGTLTLVTEDPANSVSIPVDEEGRMWINLQGPAGCYETRPLHAVWIDANGVVWGDEPMIPAEVFRDKVVMVGASAVALQDIKATSLDGVVPGVEIHAAILDNILNNEFLQRPRGLWLQVATLFVLLGAGQLLVRRQSVFFSVGLFGLLVLGMWGGVLGLFLQETLWLDLVVPTIGLVCVFAEAQTVQYFTEGKQKREIRNVFQRYLPSTVVNEVLKVPIEELKLGGERKELTVFFSDIEGFTGISEGLAPEQLVSMLNVYLSEMSDIVGQAGGTLDKYIGDCIMAFWGAPLPTENGAIQACRAALENQQRLAVLRERFVQEGLPALRARIGINTGQILVGNMGSDSHFSYTVMGDEVNLASRLEGANKQYGTYIMLGENTYERAKETIEARFLDRLRVKGRGAPVGVYELMSLRGELSAQQEELRSIYLEGLDLYRNEQWEPARDRFLAGLAVMPEDGPCETYVARCQHFMEHPPAAPWDGVYTMTTK